MAYNADQLPSQTKSSWRKGRAFIKKATARKRRRIANRLLDDAPRGNRYRGYAS